MKRVTTLFLILAAIFMISAPTSKADEVFTFVVKKQEEKAKSRWSLSEWLDTRDRMRLMDLWLAMHSPSPYEFYIGGETRLPQSGAERNLNFGFHLAAFATIFGLDFSKSFSPDSQMSASFLLRILGYHAQGTNITLHAGIRSRDQVTVRRNGYAGIGSSIYLARNFGLDGLYRFHARSVPRYNGQAAEAHYFHGGAFIDFRFLRVYGNYYSEMGGDGVIAGTRLYF